MSRIGVPTRSNSALARLTNEVFPDPHGPRTPTTTPSVASSVRTFVAKERAASALFSASSSIRRIGLSLRTGTSLPVGFPNAAPASARPARRSEPRASPHRERPNSPGATCLAATCRSSPIPQVCASGSLTSRPTHAALLRIRACRPSAPSWLTRPSAVVLSTTVTPLFRARAGGVPSPASQRSSVDSRTLDLHRVISRFAFAVFSLPISERRCQLPVHFLTVVDREVPNRRHRTSSTRVRRLLTRQEW